MVNLAVGGSRTSWPIATLMARKKVDIVSVLWGYNDWCYFNNRAVTMQHYEQFLDELRIVQPDAKVYVLLPIHTNTTTPSNNKGETLQELSGAIAALVTSCQPIDPNLFLINGADYTDSSSLSDGVHLSVNGVADFANTIAQLMQL